MLLHRASFRPIGVTKKAVSDGPEWVKKGPRATGKATLLAAAVSSDGKLLAVGGGDRLVHIYDARSHKLVKVTYWLHACLMLNNSGQATANDDVKVHCTKAGSMWLLHAMDIAYSIFLFARLCMASCDEAWKGFQLIAWASATQCARASYSCAYSKCCASSQCTSSV